MTKIGIFRCRQNESKCPLTSCFKSLQGKEQGFRGYGDAELTGVFTLSEAAEDNVSLAKILQSKGAEAIHIVTCSFARKGEGKTWHLGGGFYPSVDEVARRIAEETGLPCVKGTAHLPEGYEPEVFR